MKCTCLSQIKSGLIWLHFKFELPNESVCFVVLIIFRLGWMLWQKWTTLASWPLNAVRTTSPWTAASLLTNWVTTAPLTIQKVEGHAPFIPSWSKTFQNCFRVWISSTSRPLDKPSIISTCRRVCYLHPGTSRDNQWPHRRRNSTRFSNAGRLRVWPFQTSSSRWL